MHVILAAFSAVLILLCLLDGFEVIILTRRVTHRFRFARFYYLSTWQLWRWIALRMRPGRRRQAMLSLFGPLALLSLITIWAAVLILGFAMLHWSLRSPLHTLDSHVGFSTYLYLSGTTFFTVGYGDVTPAGGFARMLAVVEGGMGFGFLAVIISYMPVLSQAASRREIVTALLDARAGSPPTAAEVLVRLGRTRNPSIFESTLLEWERWAAELLESHLSFPGLSYYRAQHDNQSWLATLTTILDTTTLLMIGVKGGDVYQAQLTFAMARHAAVDMLLVLKLAPLPPGADRLCCDRFERLQLMLREAGFEMDASPATEQQIRDMRALYEPFLNALAHHLLFDLPAIVSDETIADNWQRSAWVPRPPGIGQLFDPNSDEHF